MGRRTRMTTTTMDHGTVCQGRHKGLPLSVLKGAMMGRDRSLSSPEEGSVAD